MANKKSEKKEVAVVEVDVKKKVEGMEKALQFIEIKNDDDMAKAGVMQVNIKQLQKYITQEKKKQLDPAKETVKAINAFWAPFEDKVEQGLKALTSTMIVYHDVQEQARKKKEDSIVARQEKGQLKEETAVNKLDELGEEKKTMHTGEGSVTFTKIKKVQCMDVKLLSPLEIHKLAVDGYLVWDQVKARRDALLGIEIVGVSIYEETSTNTRA